VKWNNTPKPKGVPMFTEYAVYNPDWNVLRSFLCHHCWIVIWVRVNLVSSFSVTYFTVWNDIQGHLFKHFPICNTNMFFFRYIMTIIHLPMNYLPLLQTIVLHHLQTYRVWTSYFVFSVQIGSEIVEGQTEHSLIIYLFSFCELQ
jgi:hypothetical protein